MSWIDEVRTTMQRRDFAMVSAAAAAALVLSVLLTWLLAAGGTEAALVPLWAALILLVVAPALAVGDFVSAHRTHDRGLSTIGWLVVLAWLLALGGLFVLLLLLVSAMGQLGGAIGGL